MDPLADLADRWRVEADAYERDAALVRADRVLRQVAEELEDAFLAYQEEALTVAEAAAESGYSESPLRALLAEERLPNVGREGAPRIRRRDLPAKLTPERRPTLSLAEEALERRHGDPTARNNRRGSPPEDDTVRGVGTFDPATTHPLAGVRDVPADLDAALGGQP